MPDLHIQHAEGTRNVKGEAMMYMVCDGHGGSRASKFCASNMHRYLTARLPPKLPQFSDQEELRAFSEKVQLALCEAFVQTDNDWMERRHNSGSTVTVVLVTGPLVTVANIGDSSAVLDTGLSMLELTSSHRIQDNIREQARLKAAGCQVAPLGFHLQGPATPGEPGVGPLRVWPGGLCVARSIGDADAGPQIVPIPHIKQIIAPSTGCRIIVATDGLWDVLSFNKVVSAARFNNATDAASELVSLVNREQRVIDDTSILVIDLLPPTSTSFPGVVAAQRAAAGVLSPGQKKSGGLFACFRPEVQEPDSRDATGHGHLPLYADVDCLVAFPSFKEGLYRNACVKRVKAGNPGALGSASVDSSVSSVVHKQLPVSESFEANSPSGVGGGHGAIATVASVKAVLEGVESMKLDSRGDGSAKERSRKGVLDDPTSHSGKEFSSSSSPASPLELPMIRA